MTISEDKLLRQREAWKTGEPPEPDKGDPSIPRMHRQVWSDQEGAAVMAVCGRDVPRTQATTRPERVSCPACRKGAP